MSPNLRFLGPRLDEAVRATQVTQPGPGLGLIAQQWRQLTTEIVGAPEAPDDDDELADHEWMAMGNESYLTLLGPSADITISLEGTSPRTVRLTKGEWSTQIDYGDPRSGSGMSPIATTSRDNVRVRVANGIDILFDWTLSDGQGTDNRDFTAQLEEAQSCVVKAIDQALEQLDSDDVVLGGGTDSVIGGGETGSGLGGDPLRGAAGVAAAAAEALAARKSVETPRPVEPAWPPPGPVESEPLCPTCQAQLRPHAHFCLHCGAKIAPESGWHPTHRTDGTAQYVWDRPDPSAPPVAWLRPWLDVEILQVQGAWCEIRLENGWSGWADLRRLAPR